MRPNFHPSDELLAAYADGRLPLAPGFVVAAHLEGCDRCRSRVEDAEQAEGRRLFQAEHSSLGPDALAAALNRLSQDDRAEPSPAAKPAVLGDVRLPGAVAQVGVRSRRYLAAGLWSARVDVAVFDGWRTVVLRVPPGTKVPPHGHSGDELIAVLSGSFRDGHLYSAGDFSESGSGRDHSLQVVGDAPCACLIAIHGRLLWKGWSQVIGLALEL